MAEQPLDPDKTTDSGNKRNQVEKTAISGGKSTSSTSPVNMPAEIGGYKIIGILGEGGMGVVYEAEQPSPRRAVALKVIRGTEIVDDMRLKMFEREAATLGRLDHPNIGRIYESGRTPEGRHFFAMELVRGPELSAWLAKRPKQLDREELRLRLTIFRQICDAVHYAHQRGVIHRDLKPSNIILTAVDNSVESQSSASPGIVKILDFGLARITEEDVAATQVTEIGVIKGTLPYMAPEQARGEVDAIDVRTDVYALGIILYELLTEQRPYGVSTGSLLSAVKVICEQPPKPLAEVWKGSIRLDADLATIVSTALEKDQDRRYAGAGALADDIGRFLGSQPIQARPPSTIYMLRKMVARRKALFATIAAAAVLLVVSAIGLGILYVRSEANLERAVEAEQSARREAETSKRTSAFLVDIFQSSNPELTRGETVTAREVIEEGAARIDKELAGEPLMQARLMYTISQVYISLALFDKAQELADRALQIRQQNLPAGHIEIADSEHLLARVLEREAKIKEADQMYKLALEHYEALGETGNLGVIDVLGNYSWMLSEGGDLHKADTLIQRALAMANALPAPDESRLLNLLSNQATIKTNLSQPDSALAILQKTLPLSMKINGDSSSHVTVVLMNMAVANAMLGQMDEATSNSLRALAIARHIYGDVHPQVAKALGNVGVHYAEQGKFDQALPYMEQSLGVMKKIHGPDHPKVGMGYTNMGLMRLQSGDPKGALKNLLEAVRIHDNPEQPETPSLSFALYHLASARDALGEHAEAYRIMKRVVAMDERMFGSESPDLADDLEGLAEMARKLGKDSEALEAEARMNSIKAKLQPAAAAVSADSAVAKE